MGKISTLCSGAPRPCSVAPGPCSGAPRRVPLQKVRVPAPPARVPWAMGPSGMEHGGGSAGTRAGGNGTRAGSAGTQRRNFAHRPSLASPRRRSLRLHLSPSPLARVGWTTQRPLRPLPPCLRRDCVLSFSPPEPVRDRQECVFFLFFSFYHNFLVCDRLVSIIKFVSDLQRPWSPVQCEERKEGGW